MWTALSHHFTPLLLLTIQMGSPISDSAPPLEETIFHTIGSQHPVWNGWNETTIASTARPATPLHSSSWERKDALRFAYMRPCEFEVLAAGWVSSSGRNYWFITPRRASSVGWCFALVGRTLVFRPVWIDWNGHKLFLGRRLLYLCMCMCVLLLLFLLLFGGRMEKVGPILDVRRLVLMGQWLGLINPANVLYRFRDP